MLQEVQQSEDSLPTCSHFSLQPLFPSRILSSAKAMAAELKAEVEGLVAKISDKVRQLGSKVF